MRDFIWPLYHRWILHRGKKILGLEWITCPHHNPFYIVTPKLLDRQIKAVIRFLHMS